MKVGTDGVLLGAWADVVGIRRALDIGTGSGVIALMLGQRSEQALVHAVEIDEASYDQACDNISRARWADRLEVFHTSIQEFSRRPQEPYDLIVSNPPFFSGGTFSTNQDRNRVRHTVKLPHGDLLIAVRALLAPEGRFCVILPLIEGLRFRELAETYRFYATKMVEVRPRAGKPVERLLLQLERTRRPPDKSELVIMEGETTEWTREYKALTAAFYLQA